MLVKPQTPIINWSNPIARGLAFDMALFGRSLIDLVSLSIGTLAGATFDRNIYGPDYDFSASTSKISYTTPSLTNSQSLISIEMLLYHRGTGGSGGDAGFGRAFAKGNNAVFEIYNNDNSATNGFCFISSRVTSAGAWSAPSHSLNNWFHIVVTYDSSSTSNNPTLYTNGVATTLTRFLTPTGAVKADDSNLYVGNYNPGTGNWDGKIVYSRVWNRILSASEAKQLYFNPWQIYSPLKFYNQLNSAAATGAGSTMLMMGVGA